MEIHIDFRRIGSLGRQPRTEIHVDDHRIGSLRRRSAYKAGCMPAATACHGDNSKRPPHSGYGRDQQVPTKTGDHHIPTTTATATSTAQPQSWERETEQLGKIMCWLPGLEWTIYLLRKMTI
nr:uncharacterized protein LOC120967427 [Aegilops tauschii subsp. strangulata]